MQLTVYLSCLFYNLTEMSAVVPKMEITGSSFYWVTYLDLLLNSYIYFKAVTVDALIFLGNTFLRYKKQAYISLWIPNS